ncbi:hypothetical protein JW921_00370 [Candidatus Fermentibacterales bacterium]|nr:hypothetical protein [Candidatus Fermentibacterales bacterium]
MPEAPGVDLLRLLARATAHDLNNSLTAVLGNVSLARASGGSSEPLAGDVLLDAENASRRMRLLVEQLRSLPDCLTAGAGAVPAGSLGGMVEELLELGTGTGSGRGRVVTSCSECAILVPGAVFRFAVACVINSLLRSAPDESGLTVSISLERGPDRTGRHWVVVVESAVDPPGSRAPDVASDTSLSAADRLLGLAGGSLGRVGGTSDEGLLRIELPCLPDVDGEPDAGEAGS